MEYFTKVVFFDFGYFQNKKVVYIKTHIIDL